MRGDHQRPHNVEKPMSEYRDASGRFDIDKANADYEKLLTKVPEEYKMSIETAYKTTEFEENTGISSAFRYDTKSDRVVYNLLGMIISMITVITTEVGR